LFTIYILSFLSSHLAFPEPETTQTSKGRKEVEHFRHILLNPMLRVLSAKEFHLLAGHFAHFSRRANLDCAYVESRDSRCRSPAVQACDDKKEKKR
jgi:hypothetical protein